MSDSQLSRRLVDAAGLAELLSISEASVHRLNSGGKIPRPVRLAGCVRWSVAEVDAWIAAGAPDRRTWEHLQEATASSAARALEPSVNANGRPRSRTAAR